ncbi:hypothetical protein [uncultured Methylobacterium sp.]|jgi:hypothetical protein|uniref:hypothetical protein n=1 Tax=uncultured Methylobacterium sp. TaxID=157278 RepID=UPI002625247A|nr:hypothetical protein [uncultured Methylobacterium sp.]
MHVSVPHNISDLSITFFAQGRPFEVQKSNTNFDAIRNTLLGWDERERSVVDIDSLIRMADPAIELKVASGNRLTFAGNQILYEGTALHNVWVDKILAFKDADENFDPIFRALEDLQLNPTPAARDRLPIFVERSKLGFLPDGRIAAFKGVKADFFDVHSGSVHYGVGKTVAMPRHECNANPDRTCTTGLHLGAIDYIKSHGYGWGADRRMLLCAFWPRHVVAVPTDYQGGKMRVEQLTVLDEVDRDYVDRLLNNGQTIIRGYEASSAPAPAASEPEARAKPEPTEPWQKAKPGDWIEVSDDENVEDGAYLVVSVDDDNGDERRITVKSGPREDDTSGVFNDAVTEILAKAPDWFLAKVGDWVQFDYGGEDTIGQVIEVDDDAIDPYSEARLKIHYGDEEDWRDNDAGIVLLSEPPVVAMRVRQGDEVTIEGHDVLRDGTYTVNEIFDRTLAGDDEERIGLDVRDESFAIPNKVVKSIKREIDEAAAKGTEAAAAVVAPAADPAKAIWEQVLVGDKIRVANDDWDDGEYTVIVTDSALYVGPDGAGIQITNDDGDDLWIYNRNAVAIVERDGKPYGVPAGEVWETAEVGDTVRIEGSSFVSNGEYLVATLMTAQERGQSGNDRYAFQVAQGGWWVEKTSVKAIVRKANAVTAPAADTRPLHKQVEIGDRIKVQGSHDTPDGEYKVTEIDTRATGNYRVAVNYNDKNDRVWWVGNDTIMAIVSKANAVTAPADDARPAYLRAKIGDTVRTKGSAVTSDGVWPVIEIRESATDLSDLRLRVDGSRGPKWISSEYITEIVTSQVAVPDPAWSRAKVGDTVKIVGSSSIKDGTYEVGAVDERNGMGRRLRLKNPGGRQWVDNDHVDSIVPADGRPAYLRAKVGDTVTVKGSAKVANGNYDVAQVDEGDSQRLRIVTISGDRFWINNDFIADLVKTA